MGHTIWAQESLKNVIANGNLNALTKIIQHNKLWDLSQSELRILRNSIYAQYGYIFKSTDLQDHFKQFIWYHPVSENVDDNFTSVDKENIIRIQNRENSLMGIIRFQSTILSWIQNKNIALPSDTINFKTINLYTNPTLYQEMPQRLTIHVEMDEGVFSDFPTAFCFAMGRFFTATESNKLIQDFGYSELKNAIIFNPSILFLNDPVFSRIYNPFQNTGTLLIVFPHDGSAAYNIQANQVVNNSIKNILIIPWSVIYYVYKITNNGTLELVDTVAAN
jgi:hypothetical protein